ncbi:MAG: IclR family transcriptional regulator [Acidobacteriaceae bacterium]
MPTNNHIEAIARTLRVLEAFEGKSQVSLNELASRVPIVKSSIYRILFTLEQSGYVSKNENGKYSITPRFGRLAGEAQFSASSELPAIALPFMAAILRRFQETVNLGVLNGDEALYIRVLESPHAFRLAAHAGIRSPLHSTALGKALLCRMAPAEIERILKGKTLRRQTTRTICDRASFMRELATVRKRNYAIDNGEDSDGAKCFGAAILDASGKALAAMSISGPASRMDRIPEREIGASLIGACRDISTLLGYTSSASRKTGD